MASAAAFPLSTAFSTPAPRQKSPQAASSALSAVRQGLPNGLAGKALPHLCTCTKAGSCNRPCSATSSGASVRCRAANMGGTILASSSGVCGGREPSVLRCIKDSLNAGVARATTDWMPSARPRPCADRCAIHTDQIECATLLPAVPGWVERASCLVTSPTLTPPTSVLHYTHRLGVVT